MTMMTMMMMAAVVDSSSSSTSIDGRHSFSLTTFDPQGKLQQVERAIIASSLGTPIIAVVLPSSIELVSPQILPSPFMIDDGTPRFIQISSEIIIGHSGISSDGRLLANAAQRLVVEHSYTYQEPIPIELFLEEMALLYQQYTMKPGSRPFGTTLLVAYLPLIDQEEEKQPPPQLFRIDPSGSVIVYEENYAIINGKSLNTKNTNINNIETKIQQLVLSAQQQKEDNKIDDTNNNSYRQELVQILQEAINNKNNNKLSSSSSSTDKKQQREQEESKTTTTGDDTATKLKIPLKTRIISASLSKSNGFVVERK